MKARVCIVGATGFSGRHMVEFCLGEGLRVYGAGRHVPSDPIIHPRFDFLRGDVTNSRHAGRLIQRVRPTHVMSLVSSHELMAARNLAAALSGAAGTKLLFIGSCASYGVVPPRHQPVSEQHPVNPVSPYGRAKLALERFGLHLHQQREALVYLARTFNLVGPGQPRGFAASDIIAQYRAWQASPGWARPAIRVADPDMRRDFLDVRDAVAAYWAILEQGRPGRPYNVCSGRSVAVSDLVGLVGRLLGVSARMERGSRPGPPRSRLVRQMIGSHRRLTRETSWRPRISLEMSLQDMLEPRG